jgi:hypothetical protein
LLALRVLRSMYLELDGDVLRIRYVEIR